MTLANRSRLHRSVVYAVVVIGALAFARSTGAPPGFTGAPGELDCTVCHSDFPLNSGNGVPEIIAGPWYRPGQVLPFQLRFAANAGMRNGFQIAALTGGSGTYLYGFAPVDINTQAVGHPNSNQYLTHTFEGHMLSSWQGTFTIPSPAPRAFSFHAAFNQANGDAWLTGDYIHTRSRQLTILPLIASGTPRPGLTVGFQLDVATDAGFAYLMGTALGNSGIPIGGGRVVPLSPDLLLSLSLGGSLPTVFQNYAGLLDAQGQARAALALPPVPELAGITLHNAFVTASGAGIATVSNDEPITIVP
jgi:hypothetical protein